MACKKKRSSKNKRGDPKKKKAENAIVKLFAALPENYRHTWLTAGEIRNSLVLGGVSEDLTAEDVTKAFRRRHHIESRQWGEDHLRFYRDGCGLSKADQAKTPDERSTSDLVMLSCEYFKGEPLAVHLKAISNYKGGESEEPSGEQSGSGAVVTPPPSPPRDSSPTQCRSWQGPTYEKLIHLSLSEAISKSNTDSFPMADITGTFPLPSICMGRKDWDKFVVERSGDDASDGFCIRSKAPCSTDSCAGKLCSNCSALSNSLSHINGHVNQEVKIHPRMHMTADRILLMGPEKAAEAIQSIRECLHGETRNAERRFDRLAEQLKGLKSVQVTEDADIIETLQLLADKSLPIAERIFGKDSMQFHVFQASFEEMKGTRRDENGNVSTGVRYNPEVISYALTLVRDSDEKTYDSLSDILYLPNRKYMQQKLSKDFSEDTEDGPCKKMIQMMAAYGAKWAKENPEMSEGWDQVTISYDSMRLSPGMLLVTKRGQVNRLSGAVLPDSSDIAKQLFEQFVFKMAEETGVGPSEQNQMETVADLLTLNTEHSVYYVSSTNPKCDLCFIAGIYNTPPLNKNDIDTHLTEITMALAENEVPLFRRVEVSDCAGSNVGYTNATCHLPARNFIPQSVLDKHGLDGEYNVAYESYVDGRAVFCLDDAPHVLKRVFNGARDRDLQYEHDSEQHPMTLQTLKDHYECVVKGSDEFALRKYRKFTMSHFEMNADRAQKMKVKPAAQVLSATMVDLIDHVASTPNAHFPKVPYSQRKEVFKRVRELCENMNQWFDLCNSKEPNRPSDYRVWVKPSNGAEIADKFLSILKWFEDWKESITDSTGTVHWEHFVTEETYCSMQQCCYGFASMIYDLTLSNKKQSLALFKMNQDRCENHYGHVRGACGNCRHPMQQQANACAVTSHLKRSIKLSAYVNVTATKRQRTA